MTQNGSKRSKTAKNGSMARNYIKLVQNDLKWIKCCQINKQIPPTTQKSIPSIWCNCLCDFPIFVSAVPLSCVYAQIGAWEIPIGKVSDHPLKTGCFFQGAGTKDCKMTFSGWGDGEFWCIYANILKLVSWATQPTKFQSPAPQGSGVVSIFFYIFPVFSRLVQNPCYPKFYFVVFGAPLRDS